MGTKTIVSRRTLHVPTKDFRPHEIDPMTGGHRKEGNYDVETVVPDESGWTRPVDLDEKEADRLIAAHPEAFKISDKPADKPAEKPAAVK